jgi:hypothetical protein
VRYLVGGAFTGGTDLIVWRDSKVSQTPFACGTLPPWYPLPQEGLVVFDEQENPFVVAATEFPFGLQSRRSPVGGPELQVPFNFGWMYLNLNHNVLAGSDPPEDPSAAQAWVTVVHDAEGRFSVGYNATQLDSATQALHFTPGP